jgi:hypothetical protein
MHGSHALVARDHQFVPANSNQQDDGCRVAMLEAVLAAQEPVIGAAILTAAAFRLRDENGLIETLRRLSQAVANHEAVVAQEVA